MFKGCFYVITDEGDKLLGAFDSREWFAKLVAQAHVINPRLGVSIHGTINGRVISGEMTVEDAIRLLG